MLWETHRVMTDLSARIVGVPTKARKELIEWVIWPDKYKSSVWDHFYVPPFKTYSIDDAVKYLNKGTWKSLAVVHHYIQDLSNPFHTSFSNQLLHQPVEKYIEKHLKELLEGFVPRPVYITDFKEQLIELANISNSRLPELIHFWKTKDEYNLKKLLKGVIHDAINLQIGLLEYVIGYMV